MSKVSTIFCKFHQFRKYLHTFSKKKKKKKNVLNWPKFALSAVFGKISPENEPFLSDIKTDTNILPER